MVSRAWFRYFARSSNESSGTANPLKLSFYKADFSIMPVKNDLTVEGSISQFSTASSSMFCGCGF